MTINQFSIENMRDELSRAKIKAAEDAKTIAELNNENSLFRDLLKSNGLIGDRDGIDNLWIECEWVPLRELLANNKPNIDFPLLLQDEAG